MKSLHQHIKESFKISKNKMYNFRPKTKEELQHIIYDEIEQNPDADLNFIDVSKITDMSKLFSLDIVIPGVNHEWLKKVRNIKIDKWDVSNVTDMSWMFADCINLDCDISDWNVSRCEKMYCMFRECHKFNSDLGSWDVSKVENMGFMFTMCYEFNCNLGKWDVKEVKVMDHMFWGCKKFVGDGIAYWAPKKLGNCNNVFKDCPNMEDYPIWYLSHIYKI